MRKFRVLSSLCLICGIVMFAWAAIGVSDTGQVLVGPPNATASNWPASLGNQQANPNTAAYKTTVEYVETFYPLWFTYFQTKIAGQNRLVGPEQVTPLYQTVVAINVDTLYASAVLYLADQPVILTIPPTTVSFSTLSLDPYGNIFEDLVPEAAGIYALIGPDYQGAIPPNVTPIEMPLNDTFLIFRADRFSSAGEQTAETFRTQLHTEPLCAYEKAPCPQGTPPGGYTLIVPEVAFAIPYKTVADDLIERSPLDFLNQLQEAVAGPRTPPLSKSEQQLAKMFDELFNSYSIDRSVFEAGAQAAHAAILDNYLSNRDANQWIHFTDMGHWGNNVLNRSSITEFIQYGNGIATAAYYHTFLDSEGAPLEGSNPQGYTLTFAATGQSSQPETKRFWSLTAYTPDAIELIPNSANKYAVASYTPNLVYNGDGSLTIYIARTLPVGAPEANWLPVSNHPFNIMLRDYGPEGSVSDNTYLPPPIVPGE